LMGLLLLISPPGYGKTTLMEYIASRLGLVFMKINGPAIGHSVTNLDPAAATNSAAREELEKLNLAFEMGDNVMIYLDDIQHCNPELLQKFISLCDAQRKVEGVYKGVSKTYDLRGKKVAVVMAGNPYTESGEKFRIPDMLANRADIYNLGDIIGGKARAFELSYLENSLTSNPVMNGLHGKSQQDLYTLIRMAETGERDGADFESGHSPEEISDYLNLLDKMLLVRNIILKVNRQYILSAGQAEEYRTEPAFKLQGSYRDMNKITEKLNPLLNEQELQTLLLSHYENESQTLTSGAEFNFLKFKELFGVLNEDEQARKAQILGTFQRQQKLSGLGGNQLGHVLEQMEVIARGIQNIGEAIWGVPVENVKEVKEKTEKKN
ncbi:MAG TPA: AAA family ATPase, partial [Cryomorphaceae bacterium]|nr:AAA family ATPase [Cryomorphaceae bacterium]